MSNQYNCVQIIDDSDSEADEVKLSERIMQKHFFKIINGLKLIKLKDLKIVFSFL